jgi:hypothetical protein
MKVLNRVGGTFLLLVLGIAAISGFQSSTGRPMWDSLWNATASVLSYTRTQVLRLDGTSVAGNWRAAVGWSAVGVILLLVLLPKPVSVRTFTLLLLGAAAASFVLWDPTVVD